MYLLTLAAGEQEQFMPLVEALDGPLTVDEDNDIRDQYSMFTWKHARTAQEAGDILSRPAEGDNIAKVLYVHHSAGQEGLEFARNAKGLYTPPPLLIAYQAGLPEDFDELPLADYRGHFDEALSTETWEEIAGCLEHIVKNS